jgi:hypothetical protein
VLIYAAAEWWVWSGEVLMRQVRAGEVPQRWVQTGAGEPGGQACGPGPRARRSWTIFLVA